MADDDNRASKDRQSFLNTFDDVDKFLYASESFDDELLNKHTDVDITTDLGSSGSGFNSTSPTPFNNSPLDRSITRIYSERPNVTMEDRISVSSATPTLPLHSDTPLPLADTPLPNTDNRPQSTELTSSDEITVHQSTDSFQTEELKRMAGLTSREFKMDSSLHNNDIFSPEKSIPKIKVEENQSGEIASELHAKGLAKHLASPVKETNLLDKVSFMDSSAPNTLMATGASIADLPFEEDVAFKQLEKSDYIIREETPQELFYEDKSEVKVSEVEEEVNKILEEVKSSERGYSSDQFDSEEDDDTIYSNQDVPDDIAERIFQTEYEVRSPERAPSSHSKSALNPFESTPINNERVVDQPAGFDLSPVKKDDSKSVALIEDCKSITSSVELSREKDMAYYLAKIKAKAAQKSLDLKSSKESSRTSSKSEKSPEFVKPKTAAPKKRLGPIRPSSSSVGKKSAPSKSAAQISKSRVPVRSQTAVRQTRIAQSPVAAYIRGEPPATAASLGSGKSIAAADLAKQPLGNTWTCALTDKSLVEVIQSNGDVEAWKELYKRTQQELKQVQDQMQETERLHGALVSALKASHSQELLNYEQDVYLLQSKVKSAGLAGEGDADARVEHLNKQVAELETLISGSQAENVKLYDEMKALKENQKEEVTRLYLENKDLAANNVAFKQLLEQRESTIRQLQQKQQSLALADKLSSLPKLAALQEELDDYKQREIMLKQRLSMLESRGSGSPRQFSDAAVNSSLIHVENQITSLVKDHTQEREELYKKLEALLKENTRLRTDSDTLQRREERILELQQTVKTLKSPEHQKQLVTLATAESCRTVSDLKRQVAELESALHKRHPDSIAALIAATQPADYSAKIQEMQENLVRVQAEYEDHISKLEREKTSSAEICEVEEINKVLTEKVKRMEEMNAQMYERTVQLEQENKDVREGQIPTGDLKKRMELLQDKLKLQDEEITHLKTKLLSAAAPAKQYNPEQFEGQDATEVRKENTFLKTKCDLLTIDYNQQKSTLLGIKVTHETEVMRISDDHAFKVDKLMQHHEGERQKLVSQHATRFAESEVAKLKSKVETLEMQVSHYSDQASQLPKLQSEVRGMRTKENTLVEQITKLGHELEEAAAQQPPSVHQYRIIQQKLENMENAHKNEIEQLQRIIDSYEKDKVRVVIADEHIVKKYKEMLVEKNLQIEKFQLEIDSIISLCMELQGHGIILPKISRAGK